MTISGGALAVLIFAILVDGGIIAVAFHSFLKKKYTADRQDLQ